MVEPQEKIRAQSEEAKSQSFSDAQLSNQTSSEESAGCCQNKVQVAILREKLNHAHIEIESLRKETDLLRKKFLHNEQEHEKLQRKQRKLAKQVEKSLKLRIKTLEAELRRFSMADDQSQIESLYNPQSEEPQFIIQEHNDEV